MSNELKALETWAGTLLERLQPTQRRELNRKIAIALRRSQAQRIASQRAPDGQAYVPRKNRPALRSKHGRIRHKKTAMFQKIRLNKHLKIQYDAHQISIGFFGRVARIAKVHQEGLKDKITKNGPKYQYPNRSLLGLTLADKIFILDLLCENIA